MNHKLFLLTTFLLLIFIRSGSWATDSNRMVGGDRDNKGCIGSAGYTWSYLMKQCVQPWDIKNSSVEKYCMNDGSAVYQFSVIYSKDHSKAEIIGIDSSGGGVLDAVNITEKDGSKILIQNKMGHIQIIKIIQNDKNLVLPFLDIGGKRFTTDGC